MTSKRSSDDHARCTRTAGGVALVHGFRVHAEGDLPRTFVRALKLLQAKGFADDSCTIVKTTMGKQSGVTHEGGRYVHAKNPYAHDVIQMMRERGIEPPPMPFVLAPGPKVLFHEWGHHVDTVWSGEDVDVPFSFRWFSNFYRVNYRRLVDPRSADPGWAVGPVETEVDASDIVPQWKIAASELFADLFEDWMREDNKVSWDVCEPGSLDHRSSDRLCLIRLDLLPNVATGTVRNQTYALSDQGLHHHPERPGIRADLLGPHTNVTVARLREAMKRIRAGS